MFIFYIFTFELASYLQIVIKNVLRAYTTRLRTHLYIAFFAKKKPRDDGKGHAQDSRG